MKAMRELTRPGKMCANTFVQRITKVRRKAVFTCAAAEHTPSSRDRRFTIWSYLVQGSPSCTSRMNDVNS